MNLAILLILFFVFFKIGLFSFGGGYAILPLIQADVVDLHKWVNVQQFTDIVAISQVTPGPISLNAATYVGYLIGNKVGFWDAFVMGTVATIGLILPSVIVMSFFSKFYLEFQDNKYMDNAFAGLKIVVVGLILAAAIMLIDKNNFIDWKSVVIFIVSITLVLKWKVNPILLTVIAAIAGIIIY
jgi:hypothetical protein